MGDVIRNTRFTKRTPAQRARLRRKFARRDASAPTRSGADGRRVVAPAKRR